MLTPGLHWKTEARGKAPTCLQSGRKAPFPHGSMGNFFERKFPFRFGYARDFANPPAFLVWPFPPSAAIA